MLYLDTSALVKLFVVERGSAEVQAWVAAANVLITARITYVEARAAMARGRRVGLLSESELRRAVTELDAGFRTYAIVEIDEPLVLRAGRLAEAHGLRGYDAVQLAAALEAEPDRAPFRFASFDHGLVEAARREGLRVPGLAERVEERPMARYRARRGSRVLPRVAAS